jgi:hypothetical protein
MSHFFDPDDEAALGEIFASELRSAFPEVELPKRVVHDHVAAMIVAAQLLAEEGVSVPDPVSDPSPQGLTTQRRKRMRGRMFRRVVAVAAGLLLSLGGLAFAGAFQGTDDPGDDDPTAIVADLTDDDQGEDADDQDGDDQGEDGDDQGEDGDDQGEDGDDQGEDGDDQGEDGDDQGEDGDDQGEDADDQGEDGDDQGEDGDDQGEDDNAGDDEGDDGDSQDSESNDDQGDGGDSQD